MMKKLLFTASFLLLLLGCKYADDLEAPTTKSGSITRFAVYQHYMYVLNLNEVQTYDIQDKAHPVLLHSLTTDYGLETITIYDNTIFLGSISALYILDISNPAAPFILSQSERLSDLGFSGCDPVVVQGNYAYSTIKIIENACGKVSAESALVVYDISDKAAPLVVNTYELGIPNGLGYSDHYLFVCDEGTDKILVFDIENPAAITLTDYSVPLTDPVDLIVDGQRLIVAAKTDFHILDISDISQIHQVGQITR